MKAVRLYAKCDLRVEEVAAPSSLENGWVRLKIDAAGICGSDIHNFQTGRWITRAPTIAGHEVTGRVTNVGPGVETLRIGDHVVADSRFWCGECKACREGRHHFCARLGFIGEVCDGGFAEEAVLPERLLIRIDPAIPPEVAATAEPLAVALHAVKRLDAPTGAPVLVVGCGPIGGFVLLVLRKLTDGLILVADRNAARANLVAETTGAKIVPIDSASISSALRGQDLLFAVEATGNIGALKSLIGTVANGASIALVGISHKTLEFDPNIIVERELTFLGCHAFQHELPEAAMFLKDYAVGIKKLIREIIALENVPAAYQRLIVGDSLGLKTIIRM